MNSENRDKEVSAALHCYVAIREQAEQAVEQWNNHDSLNDSRIREPYEVAIARHFLMLLDVVEQASGSGFESAAANALVKTAVDCYRGTASR